MWDPQQYLVFGDERSRPFFDLVRRIDVDSARAVVDLGCGPGNLTAVLADRWPTAEGLGVDSSEQMNAAALQGVEATAGLSFELGDVRSWAPSGPLDVVVSNATLHWVPEHADLLSRYLGWLVPGGWLAFQVPGNFRSPSHQLLADLRLSPRWKAQVGDGAERHLAV